MKKRGVILLLGIFVIMIFSTYYISNPLFSNENSLDSDSNQTNRVQSVPETSNTISTAMFIGEGDHPAIFMNPDGHNWYWIPGRFDESLVITVYFTTAQGNLNLALHNFTHLLASNILPIGNKNLTYVISDSFDYYIHIFNTTQFTGSFDLKITWDDKYEPNNFIGNAPDIFPNWYSNLRCYDDDWFKIWMNMGDQFTIDLIFTHTLGDIDLELWENPTKMLTFSYSPDDNEHISWGASYDGFHYVRVVNNSIGNTYNLDIIMMGTMFDKYENNDEYGSAHELYKGYYHDLWCKDDDWYKVLLDLGEQCTIDTFFENDSGDLDLELYNKFNSITPIDVSKSPDDDESITFTSTYDGYYYIRVYYTNNENFYEMKIGGQEVTIFYDNFDSGVPKSDWSGIGGSNYWHVTSYDSKSPSYSLWCGNESSGTYNKEMDGKNVQYRDSIILSGLDFQDFCYVELSMDYKMDTGGSSGDRSGFSVRVLGDQVYLDSKYTDNIFEMGENSQDSLIWNNFSHDLSFFCGYENVEIIFYFDADGFDDNYTGIMADNIRITGIKDEKLWGSTLDLEREEEYYYHISYIDHEEWSKVFGRDLPWYASDIKFEIFGIYDRGSYWDVVVRFWDSSDDFDELHGTEEITYKVYKNPLNMKAGANFFIPSNNVWKYLDRADNYDWYGNYDIHHWDEPMWDEYNIEFCFDDFRVHLTYSSNGILQGMRIHKNYATSNELIFEMWRTDYGKEPDEEDEDEKDAIPGYDIPIVVILVSIVSIIYALKIKKSRNK